MANHKNFLKRIQEQEQRLEQQRVKSQAARDHAERALNRSRALRSKREDAKQAAARIAKKVAP